MVETQPLVPAQLCSEHTTCPRAILVHEPAHIGDHDRLRKASEQRAEQFLFRERPDWNRYAAQHRAFMEVLRQHVPAVIRLSDLVGQDPWLSPALEQPNQVFTRDSVITLPWAPQVFFKARLKPGLRRHESEVTGAALSKLGLQELLTLPADVFLEGGDVIPFSHGGRRTLLIGYGPRTSFAGIEFLQQSLIPDYADEIIAIALADWRMNLDGGFVPVTDRVVVSDVSSVQKATLLDAHGGRDFDLWLMLEDLGITVLETTPDESVYRQSCNCVCLGDERAIFYDLCPRVNDLLRGQGVQVHTIPGSELVKGRGGPRCMSRPLYA